MNSGAEHTANYQALAIITRVLMAGIVLITALLGIISFMILGHFLFLVPVAMASIEMALKFPSQSKIEPTIKPGTFLNFKK